MSSSHSNPTDTETCNQDDDQLDVEIAAGDEGDRNETIEPAATYNNQNRQMKRVLANRNSARASYQRRKTALSELQSTTADLSEKNASLVLENKQLRQKLRELQQQMSLMLMSGNRSASVPPGSLSGLPHSMLGVAGLAPNMSLASQLGQFRQNNQCFGLSHMASSSIPPAQPTGDQQARAALLSHMASSNTAPAQPNGGDQQARAALLATNQYLARALGLPPPG